MRLNDGEALYVNLSQTAYYSNEHYQESAENKRRNPICLIFHFQAIVDKNHVDSDHDLLIFKF